MNSHLRPVDSIRSTRASGSATASGARESRRPRRGRRSGAPAQRRDLEPGQRVGDVDAPRLLGVAHRARRRRVLGEERENGAQRRARLVGELEPARARLGAQSLSSGATMTQRSGSSPSLKVSIPARSLRCWWTTRRSLGGHRLELDLLARLQRPLGGAVGLALDRLLAALAVAGGVDDHPLSLLPPWNAAR